MDGYLECSLLLLLPIYRLQIYHCVRTIKFCSVVFGVTLRLLVINTSSSSPAVNKLRPYQCHQLAMVRRSWVYCTWRSNRLQPAMEPDIGSESSEYCHNVCYGKTKMVLLPDGDKNLKICLFVSTECTNVTDRRTPHDGVGRACIASRGKKDV